MEELKIYPSGGGGGEGVLIQGDYIWDYIWVTYLGGIYMGCTLTRFSPKIVERPYTVNPLS